MTITIPVGFGMCQIRWIVSGSSRESVSTFGYDPATLDPDGNAFAIHGALTASGRPCVAGNMVVGWTYLGVRTLEMDDTGPISGQFDGNVIGSATGNPTPPNVAVLVRKATASGGRRNRGRMYLPPIYPGEENIGPNGTIAATQLGEVSTRWNAFRTAMTSAVLPIVLFHSESPFTPTPVTNFVVQAQVATQRRRLRRG